MLRGIYRRASLPDLGPMQSSGRLCLVDYIQVRPVHCTLEGGGEIMQEVQQSMRDIQGLRSAGSPSRQDTGFGGGGGAPDGLSPHDAPPQDMLPDAPRKSGFKGQALS